MKKMEPSWKPATDKYTDAADLLTKRHRLLRAGFQHGDADILWLYRAPSVMWLRNRAPSAFRLLNALAQAPSSTLELSAILGVSIGTAKSAVVKLRKRGVVHRVGRLYRLSAPVR